METQTQNSAEEKPDWRDTVKALRERKAREPGVRYLVTDDEGRIWSI
ncbi:MAG: hypothetical protein HY558_00945 [Euryarchaeota archaeon]|nr:hypothetical protein [Euryarchaeota archaeon]